VEWLIGLPVLALTLGYLSEVAQRHTVTRQRDEALRDLAAAQERLARARSARNEWRTWARTIPATRYDGWEIAAGAMSRWSDAVDDDSDTRP